VLAVVLDVVAAVVVVVVLVWNEKTNQEHFIHSLPFYM
jgi:hypothetical protein